MNSLHLILPCSLGIVSLVLWRLANRLDPWVRLPLGIYLGSYLLTTFLGGVLISLSDGQVIDALGCSADMSVVSDFSSWRYWGLLFAPLIVPPACLLCLQRLRRVDPVAATLAPHASERVSPMALGGVYALFVGYCVTTLISAGFIANVFQWLSLQDNYLTMILRRQETLESLGSVFFGIAYITLPTLSFAALYQYRRLRTLGWRLMFLFVSASTVLINMELMQKAPTLLFLVFIGVALIELRTLKLRALAYILGGLIGALTTIQALIFESWGWWDSVQLLIFRMASSFPFYVNIYPDQLPYSGVETGLHLVGLGEPATDCFTVFNVMYPSVTWVQGAAAAPAHMRAYSQAGLLYAFITLVLIGFILKAISELRRRVNGPISFALYVQSLVFLYYTTQTSLRESIISCYGIFWAFIGLLPLVILQCSQHTHLLFNIRPAIDQGGAPHASMVATRPVTYSRRPLADRAGTAGRGA